MSTTRIRPLLAVGATIAVAGALAPAATAKPIAKSTFDTASEGWKVVGDTSGDPEKPTQVPTGGNPGGYIEAEDAVTGGTMYWRAPAKYLGDKSSAYKGTLSFSLTQSENSSQFENDDVVLEGVGLRLILTDGISPNPPLFPNWGAYTAPLVKTLWFDQTNGEPASGQDMKAVLGDLDDLYIRAEYQSGADTDGLDSVKLKKFRPQNRG